MNKNYDDYEDENFDMTEIKDINNILFGLEQKVQDDIDEWVENQAEYGGIYDEEEEQQIVREFWKEKGIY